MNGEPVDLGEYCRAVESYLCRRNEGHLVRVVGPAFDCVAAWAAKGVPLRVAYRGTVTGIQPLDLQIDYRDAQMAAPQTALVELRTNTNQIARTTATDTVEAEASAMTNGFAATAGNAAPWHRIELAGLQHAWHLDETIAPADQYLTSPAFTVDASGTEDGVR